MFQEIDIVLGSQSPQRLQLLSNLVDREHIFVRPPRESDEPGFDNVSDWSAITAQLANIAALKHADVRAQSQTDEIVLTADTVIVSGSGEGPGTVLGKPNEPDWQTDVRNWFQEFLSGRMHRAATALQLSCGDRTECRLTVTHVRFRTIDDDLLEWYLSTEESRGKAGGYAIQGAGSVFVESIEGSLSNVVGLPLEAVHECLSQMNAAD